MRTRERCEWEGEEEKSRKGRDGQEGEKRDL
jgi:hypothetical protein